MTATSGPKPFGWRPPIVCIPELAMPVIWPAPEVPRRDAADYEIPRSAKSLIKTAVENCWQIKRSTYARGTAPASNSNWTPLKVVDSFVLTVAKYPLVCRAYWIDGSFGGCWVTSAERGDSTKVNSLDLRRVLKGELE